MSRQYNQGMGLGPRSLSLPTCGLVTLCPHTHKGLRQEEPGSHGPLPPMSTPVWPQSQPTC